MLSRQLCATALVFVAGLFVLEFRGIGKFDAAAQSLAADTKNAKDSSAEIARQEIALAKAALPIVTQLEKQGRTDSGSNSVSSWSKRLLEATRKSGATKAEVAKELSNHLLRMDERVEIMQARQQSARATETEVLNARYEALEAKAWLVEAQGE